ncbi:MAG: Ig-like domain-containing protein [Sedimentisphaerales bacterium]|nr:Ig-like domain-containing protein [Sedimentisphaerales bacterium]
MKWESSGANKRCNYVKIGVFFLCSTIISLFYCQPLYSESLGELTTTMALGEELDSATKPAVQFNQATTQDPNAPAAGQEKSSSAPLVIKTSPPAFANDVDPSLKEITVTFDQPMNKSWSWTGSAQTLPKMAAPPTFDQAQTTCTLPVTLEPGKVYQVGINDETRHNFKNVKNMPAKQYVILFATKGSDGKTTLIPEDMLQEAKAINGISSVPAPTAAASKATPIVESAPAQTPQPAEEIKISKNDDAPDINDFNSFQRELIRINIETRSEEQQWLGPLERKEDMVRAIDELVAAELRFIQKLAESENAEQTVKAIELVLRQRQDRLNKLITKLNDELRAERQQQTRERRPRRINRTEGEEQPQRRSRRAREPNSVGQQY